MQLIAKLIQLQPLQTGMGRNGEWKKQEIIVETDGQYPKKVCISIWGDKINPSVLQVGNTLDVSFDVESREYNGRWYTTIRAWNVTKATGAQAPEDMPPPPFDLNAAPAPEWRSNFDSMDNSNSNTDLPF